ncbi:hypothetical protein CVT24_003570 [Panaeolus cyanescens]|uniref:tRNA (cytosine(38)-C(5))-methyltransferase n=1 Tax=Panaeolus cyanescens TaxID=181874 RepID=A0A409Y7R6_9AGAR|nr:hypothetical protein CVT24_003570 [Panaeolus cyanescens]
MPIRALEFYSGIGGLHLALTRAQPDAQVVKAFDWDQTACQVYSANHGRIVDKVDIGLLSASDLSKYQADIWLLSPACQPYTVLNPDAKGAQDPRAQSFLHLVQTVLPELADSNDHPSRLLVENVAGFESSSTRQILVSTMRSLGYSTLEVILTPLQFGIPNSRLRYYFLAKKAPYRFADVPHEQADDVWRKLPGQMVDWCDPRFESSEGPASDNSVKPIRDYLDASSEEPSPFSIPDKILEKWGRLFDIVTPSSRRTCCFTRGYTQLVERSGSIVQENEELQTTATFDQFLAQQSEGHDRAVEIIHPLRLRYFSPSELLRIFAFEQPSTPEREFKFKWPQSTSKKSKYKLIGNSVNVKVVEELIRYLFHEPNMVDG